MNKIYKALSAPEQAALQDEVEALKQREAALTDELYAANTMLHVFKKGNERLYAQVERLHDAIFHACCDLAEADITDDDGLKQTHNALLQANQETPAQSLATRDKEQRLIGRREMQEACADKAASTMRWSGYAGDFASAIRNLTPETINEDPTNV